MPTRASGVRASGRARAVRSPFVAPSKGVVGVFGIGALFGLLTPNPLLTAGALLVVPLLVRLLWREGETPVLLFAALYQWIQVSARLFYADIQGVPVGSFASHASPAQLQEAVALGLVGLVVLAGAAHVVLRRLGPSRQARARIEQFSLWRLFVLYVALVLYGQLLLYFAGLFGPLREVLVPAAQVKWVLFFVLGYAVLRRRSGYAFLAAAVVTEFILGIGYFSGFKNVFLLLAVVVFTVQGRPSGRTLGVASLFVAGLLLMGSIWMSIRAEYRSYVNQGTQTQTVRVSKVDQVRQAFSLASEVSVDDAVRNLDAVALRLSYVDLFAVVLDYVPDSRRHTAGKLWGGAVQHVLMPRLFFPGKPALPSDTRRTEKYTGIDFAGGAQGTSVSMGYMAESYIDFGRYGMFLPIALLGLIWGGIYYYFVSRASINIIGQGFATAVLYNASQFEMTSIKLIGGVLTTFLVFALIQAFIVPPVSRWLRRQDDGR